MKKVVVSGKRKSAVSRVAIGDGSGKVVFNGRPIETLRKMHYLLLSEPIRIYEKVLGKLDKVDIIITSAGGGKESQIIAARLGIGKSLFKMSQSADLRKAYLEYDRQLLVADTRRKEAYKPGDSKARSKRQKRATVKTKFLN